MTKRFGPFLLPQIETPYTGSKWNTGEPEHGAVFLLPNGYALSMQQRIRGCWDPEYNTVEAAILVPRADGRMYVETQIIRQMTNGDDDVLGYASSGQVIALMEKLAKLPKHENYRDDLPEINAGYYDLVPLDTASIKTNPQKMEPRQQPKPVAPTARNIVATRAPSRQQPTEPPVKHSLASSSRPVDVIDVAVSASTPESVNDAFSLISRIYNLGYDERTLAPGREALLLLAPKGASEKVLQLFIAKAEFALRIEVGVDEALGAFSKLASVCPHMKEQICEGVEGLKSSDGLEKRPYLTSNINRALLGLGRT